MPYNLQTPRILWGALAGSVVLLYVVLMTMHFPARPPVPPMFTPMFAVMAVAVAVVSFVLPRNFVRQALAQKSFETREEASHSGHERSYRGAAAKHRVFTNPSEVRRAAMALYQTPLILSLALSEAIALFGFVLGFLGAPIETFSAFFAVGLGLILFRFPTRNRMLGPIEERFGATLG